MAEAVDGGGVDPIDAKLQSAVNSRNRVGIVLRTPGKFPAGAAGCPRAEPNRSDLQIGVT